MNPYRGKRRATALMLALAVIPVATVTAEEAAEDPAGMLGTTNGQAIYEQICQGCHMPDGRGAEGAGRYPAFAGSAALASKQYAALTILTGRGNMPAFGSRTQEIFFPPTWLTDTQVANVVNYIRTSFGNDYPDALTPEEVRALRPPQGETKP